MSGASVDLGRVDPRLLEAAGYAADTIARQFPGVTLVATSGYRSPAQQAGLVARWRAGDRSGIHGRPAERSLHSAGRALDVQFAYQGRLVRVADTPRDAFAYAADLMAPWGVRWGGLWRTPSVQHFEL